MPSRISNLAGFTTSLSSTTDLSVGVITATSLSVGDIQISSGIISAVSGVITYYGDASSLTGISAGSSITDDTSTDSSFYPLFTDSTSGILSSANVSSTKLTFNPSSATLNVGSGVTITGDGDISIAGTIYASSLNVPIDVTSFDPVAFSTASAATDIIINFNQTVGLGTTGFIEIKVGSALSESISVGSTRALLSNGGTRLTIDPTDTLPGLSTINIVMSSGFITANGTNFTGINTVGSGVTYSFDTGLSVGPLGSADQGGYVICKGGGTAWIVAPSSTQVVRNWYARCDAATLAETNAACGDWFIPSVGQLQNPGYICRTYWDSYCNPGSSAPYGQYWSDSQRVGFGAVNHGCTVYFLSGIAPMPGLGDYRNKVNSYAVRAFRCVTY